VVSLHMWRILLAASDRLIGFVTYEDTSLFFISQSTTFGYTSSKSIYAQTICSMSTRGSPMTI
jgi:hypothetical protein